MASSLPATGACRPRSNSARPKRERILDVGAGKLAYVKRLDAAGYQIRGIEFYLQRDGKIAHWQVHRHIDRVIEDLRTGGTYDVVVCDSVLNSVDSTLAEESVMLTLEHFK